MISDLSKVSITFLLLDLNIRITQANTLFAVVLIGWWKSRLPSSGFPQFFICCLSSIGFIVVVEFQVSLLLFLNVFPLNLSLNFILLFFSHIYIKLHYIAQFVNHVLILLLDIPVCSLQKIQSLLVWLLLNGHTLFTKLCFIFEVWYQQNSSHLKNISEDSAGIDQDSCLNTLCLNTDGRQHFSRALAIVPRASTTNGTTHFFIEHFL